LRIFNLLRGLSEQHLVSLITFTEHDNQPTPRALSELCQEVRQVPTRFYNANSLRALLGLLSPKPRVLVDRHVQEMEDLVRQAIQTGSFDLAIASQWYMAAYLEKNHSVPAIFEEVEVGVFRDKVNRSKEPIQRWRHRMTTLKMQSYFRNLVPRFGACTVASSNEQRIVRKMVPGYEPVEIIPNGVMVSDYDGFRMQPEEGTLVFSGSFRYEPNYQAMYWFMDAVYPLIAQKVPDLKVTITGQHDNRPLPHDEHVWRTGFVRDVRPYVAEAWGSLAPLQVGGGTRLKILEAMALGTPVVATSKGAEGLDAVPGEHLLLADKPEEFAEAVIRLMQDESLRCHLADNAYRLVREMYDWPVIMPRFLNLAERVANT
jgi:glycosyltransferase involved in cell wall biosynthesis